jgi:hypothetical protein
MSELDLARDLAGILPGIRTDTGASALDRRYHSPTRDSVDVWRTRIWTGTSPWPGWVSIG